MVDNNNIEEGNGDKEKGGPCASEILYDDDNMEEDND